MCGFERATIGQLTRGGVRGAASPTPLRRPPDTRGIGRARGYQRPRAERPGTRPAATRRSTITALVAALGLDDVTAEALRAAARRTNFVPDVAVGCELPSVPTDFTGRVAELRMLCSGLPEDGPTISLVVGKPGVGKTTLALSAAHQLARHYPDAQLYLDLRGTQPEPATAGEAIGHLLRSLNLSDQEIPVDPAGRAGRYRSLTYHRRILVVLDNAADESQVRPLLPAGPRCCVLVTSRRALLGLDATRRVTVGELNTHEAVRLLGSAAGASRTAAEPLAARTLVRLCGHLPLALRIAGNRLASRPDWPIATLVDQIADQRTRLAQLRVGDLAVRRAFEVSYAQLTPTAQTLFTLLSLVPGPDFGVGTAAAMLDVDTTEATAVLDELADAHLTEPTDRPGRFRCHDLLRLFSAERCAVLPTDRVAAARARWIGWLVTHARTAGAWLDPSAELPRTDTHITDRAQALSWLTAEHDTMLAFAHRATDIGAGADLVTLAESLAWYFDLCAAWDDWRQLTEAALSAARELADKRAIVALTNTLGLSLFCMRRLDTAMALHREALTACREIGDSLEEHTALHLLGVDLEEAGQLTDALHHHEQALAVAEQTGKPWFRGRSLGKIADCLILLGRYAEAAEFATRARGVATSIGDARGDALNLARLGQALHGQGRFADAIRDMTASAALFRRLSDRWSQAWVRHSLGLALRDSGRITAALAEFDTAVTLFREIGDRHWENVARRARDITRGAPRAAERGRGTAVDPPA